MAKNGHGSEGAAGKAARGAVPGYGDEGDAAYGLEIAFGAGNDG